MISKEATTNIHIILRWRMSLCFVFSNKKNPQKYTIKKKKRKTSCKRSFSNSLSFMWNRKKKSIFGLRASLTSDRKAIEWNLKRTNESCFFVQTDLCLCSALNHKFRHWSPFFSHFGIFFSTKTETDVSPWFKSSISDH